MRNRNILSFLCIFKSSLWITVFVVRVGCIIEAQAHPANSNSDLDAGHAGNPHSFTADYANEKPQVLLAKSLNLQKKKQLQTKFNQRFVASSSRSLNLDDESSLSREISNNESGSTTNAAAAVDDDIELDTCSGKKDGYFPNLGSGCSSYYFCAAGYQISYVCPANTFYNGEKCLANYKCPLTEYSNPCLDSINGYYPMKHNPRKYFYCYHKAKVIELTCSEGKYYDRNEKGCMTMTTSASSIRKHEPTHVDDSCRNKDNGFYTTSNTDCTKYYYCILGAKTALECQANYVFDGSLCVVNSRFSCPSNS